MAFDPSSMILLIRSGSVQCAKVVCINLNYIQNIEIEKNDNLNNEKLSGTQRLLFTTFFLFQ